MAETPSGLLFAQVDIEACVACGLCLSGCGGAGLAPGLLSEEVDPFKGEVLAAYCGHETDSELHERGQSGGVVTALLAFMLNQGVLTKPLLTECPRMARCAPNTIGLTIRKNYYQAKGPNIARSH